MTRSRPFCKEIGGGEDTFYNITFKDYCTSTPSGEKVLMVEGFTMASLCTTIPLIYKATYTYP